MSEKRYNRAQVEWQSFLSPAEFCVLDIVLFRGNNTKAHNGVGWFFHIRKLETECSVERHAIGRILKRWPFISEIGTKRDMLIQLDYSKFQLWLAERLGANAPNQVAVIGCECSQSLGANAPNNPKRLGANAPIEVQAVQKEDIEVIGNLDVQPKVDGAKDRYIESERQARRDRHKIRIIKADEEARKANGVEGGAILPETLERKISEAINLEDTIKGLK